MSKVIIIGAGLAGSLLAINLAKRGIAVDVYEARGDMRLEAVQSGRSINLALSDRGIAALREVGMDEYMLSEAVPMTGRMIHSVAGETKLLPYSGRTGEYINSVSRGGLNIALMNEAEKYGEVTFHFNERCVDFDCRSGEARFASGREVTGETLIATDGAGSAVRNAMMHGGVERFDFEQKWLEHGYKELHIPAADGGGFRLEKNALHIWPRHKFMMIALPNFDGSFTCTLFLGHGSGRSVGGADGALSPANWPSADAGGSVRTRVGGPNVADGTTNWPPADAGGSDKTRGGGPNVGDGTTNWPPAAPTTPAYGHPSSGMRGAGGSDMGFDALTSEREVRDFFGREFPDAVPLMPTLIDDFFANPTGNLGTVKCFPWNAGGRALLLGDSAHAVVPFYGQGMNCAFEDVRVLDGLIAKHGTDWETVYEEYGSVRKKNTDAIADMAEENFYEMRDATADPVFQRKRQLETALEHTFPDYFSKYSMVTFREDLPYAVAKEKGNAQDRLLMRECATIADIDSIDLDELMAKIRSIGAAS